MRTFIKNIFLAAGSLLFILLICELFLRLGGYKAVTFYPMSGFHQYDAELGWVQVPGYEADFQGREYKVRMKSNSLGFRDREYPIEKPNGLKRVVVLGDSFTWGWGVEQPEIFCEVAEQNMKGVDFINLGQTAYSTAQEYVIYKNLGMKFSPDFTVLAFGPNDIMENSGQNPKRPKYMVQNKRLILESPPTPYSLTNKLKKTLKDYFLLYSLIDYRIALLKPIQSKPNGYDWVPDYYLKSYQEKMSGPWEVTKSLLLEINKLAQHRLLIMYVPNRLQVEEDAYQQAVLSTQVDENLIDLSYPNTLIKEFAEKNRIPFLDVTPYFKGESKHVSLYFTYDGHWTKEGQHLAGELLSERLKEFL